MKAISGCTLALFVMIDAPSTRVGGDDSRPATLPGPRPRIVEIPDAAAAAKDYKYLRKMTPVPARVDGRLSSQCAPVTKAQVDGVRKAFGPHAFAYVNIYMNRDALDAFAAGSHYPPGSIIIKEKIADTPAGFVHDSRAASAPAKSAASRPASAPAARGVGGMIKQRKGYDPEHGDWEYFYFEDINNITKGKIENCIQCHKNTAETDYVFGSWLTGSGSKPGKR